MNKLRRDGILQPTHDKSLKKCKSCIFGKMAHKPFSHQVERAMDLLGLIHTDVCCPFRTMSREGASYFITFTSDFSRYGYVYLMKHNHDVFETFKVFQNEVENQLGKKIKAIRSDRRGEYLTAFSIWSTKKVDRAQRGSHRLLEMSRSDKGLEIIQEEDTQPLKILAKNIISYYVDVEEYELGDLNEPPNYKSALADPESDKWLEAMNTEIQSMKDNQVLYLVDLPSNGRTIR
ncbi:retrotransposon protein, putative, ty1-copia subclass [Tanacetum coccineum]